MRFFAPRKRKPLPAIDPAVVPAPSSSAMVMKADGFALISAAFPPEAALKNAVKEFSPSLMIVAFMAVELSKSKVLPELLIIAFPALEASENDVAPKPPSSLSKLLLIVTSPALELSKNDKNVIAPLKLLLLIVACAALESSKNRVVPEPVFRIVAFPAVDSSKNDAIPLLSLLIVASPAVDMLKNDVSPRPKLLIVAFSALEEPKNDVTPNGVPSKLSKLFIVAFPAFELSKNDVVPRLLMVALPPFDFAMEFGQTAESQYATVVVNGRAGSARFVKKKRATALCIVICATLVGDHRISGARISKE